VKKQGMKKKIKKIVLRWKYTETTWCRKVTKGIVQSRQMTKPVVTDRDLVK
jgi:hypothetical protein